MFINAQISIKGIRYIAGQEWRRSFWELNNIDSEKIVIYLDIHKLRKQYATYIRA